MSEVRKPSAAVALLRAVHLHPGIERATAVRELALPSGFAAETIARLTGLELLEERRAPHTGARGRPTTALHAHPRGPLVAIAAIAHERWQVAVAELGGATISSTSHVHGRSPDAVLSAVREELRQARRRHGPRIRAVAVSVPGTVSGTRLAQASDLGWHDVELKSLWPNDRSGRTLLTGNDATFAAVAEARRGAAAGASVAVHLFMDAAVGGAVVEAGRPLLGASGMAGEFGHMPFGDPAQRCTCGAWGCWNTSLEADALARYLDEPVPEEGVTYIRRVVAQAGDGDERALAAVRTIARSVGRGAAGLVNAFDPAMVTIGGTGRELLQVAGDELRSSYIAGLMQFRTPPPPPLVPAHFGNEAPLIGATEEAFSTVLTDEGLHAWAARRHVAGDR